MLLSKAAGAPTAPTAELALTCRVPQFIISATQIFITCEMFGVYIYIYTHTFVILFASMCYFLFQSMRVRKELPMPRGDDLV